MSKPREDKIEVSPKGAVTATLQIPPALFDMVQLLSKSSEVPVTWLLKQAIVSQFNHQALARIQRLRDTNHTMAADALQNDWNELVEEYIYIENAQVSS